MAPRMRCGRGNGPRVDDGGTLIRRLSGINVAEGNRSRAAAGNPTVCRRASEMGRARHRRLTRAVERKRRLALRQLQGNVVQLGVALDGHLEAERAVSALVETEFVPVHDPPVPLRDLLQLEPSV